MDSDDNTIDLGPTSAPGDPILVPGAAEVEDAAGDADAGSPGEAPLPPPGEAAGAPPPTSPRPLTRSSNRKIAGVAAGVGEYLGIDPTLVRVGFVIAAFIGGAGVLAYVVAWVLLPSPDTTPAGSVQQPAYRVAQSTAVAVLAVLALLATTFHGPPGDGFWVPLGLVALGVWLLVREQRDPRTSLQPPTPPATSPLAHAGGPAPSVAPPPMAMAPPAWTPPPPIEPQPTERAPREPATLTWLAFGVAALALAGGLLIREAGWADVRVAHLLGLCLVAIGLGAIASAFVGRGRGLLALGIVASLAFGVTAIAEPVLDDGVGERIEMPRTVDELEGLYQLGVGHLVLDLRELTLEDGARVAIGAELGIGQVEILVPDDVDVELTGKVDMGDLTLLDTTESGFRNELSVTGDALGTARATLVIDLDLGIGDGSVRRD